jgi:hypothetical protein
MVSLLFLLVVVAPVVGGIVLIVKGRRRGPGYPACGGCGYDVTASVGAVDRCPECGGTFVSVGILPPTTRRPGMQIAGVVLLVLGLGCVGSTILTSVGMVRARQAQAQAARAQAQAQAAQAQAAQGEGEAGNATEADAPPE